MPGIRETRQLPYSARQMFDLVADVKRYPEFLPWVIATRIRSDTETELVADMVVGFKAIREKFTSRVEKDGPHWLRVHYMDGPLRDLDNVWKFLEIGPSECEIDFCVEFAFRNPVFEALAGQYFDRAFRKLVGAFEQRAEELYGSSSSSAQIVA